MFDAQQRAFIAISGDKEICLTPKMANRHGLITGATGTGKTVTLQTLAETCSGMGVPVFAADVKGDLSGVAAEGGARASVLKRVEAYGLPAKGFAFQAFPVQFWDMFGEQGAPVRATIADMGALLLGRLLQLSDTQSEVLAVVFKIAEDEGLELIDLNDLRSLLEYVAARQDVYRGSYGNLASSSIGSIQRGLVALEQEGAALFFGEPALRLEDFIRTEGGKGVINILAADRLIHSPKLYSTFLLWLMTRLFQTLPEVGDMERPKLVFFFDEAHLLFKDAPKALLEKVEQVVRLIRSKGVGVYFISQSPSDIPDAILGQLGNRVQHALRGYTPKDMKAVKAAAQSFRPNPAFDTESVISELETGEALVSFLDEKGAPMPVERAFILPPEGQIGPLPPERRTQILANSLLHRHYAETRDRTTAHEMLQARLQQQKDGEQREALDKIAARARKDEEKKLLALEKEEKREAEKTKRFWGGVAKSVIVPLVRQVLGSLIKRK